MADVNGAMRGDVGGISIEEIALMLPDDMRNEIVSRYNMINFAKIFEDTEICSSCTAFIRSGLNMSLTARSLFMHRNTLMYRLRKVREMTGLDLRVFDDAFVFELLYSIYTLPRDTGSAESGEES